MPVPGSARTSAEGFGVQASVTRWLDVRRGEWLLLSLLVVAAFATITSYYFLKPASKSIFLAAFGAKSLPDAYIAVAIATGIVGTLYAHLSIRVSLVPMLNGVLVLLALLIAAFRLGFDLSVTGWLAWAFYVFVSTFGVLAPAMLWFAINHMLEPRQARRLLGYIGAGAIGGGIAGAYLARLALEHINERDLLWGAEAFFVLVIVTINLALARAPVRIKERSARTRSSGTFRLIVSHRYVRLLTILIAIIMTCASLAEYQFLWAVGEYVPKGKETAAYLATWYGHLNLLCLPIQLLVTAPVLRRLGVGPALLVLPTAVFAISTGMAVTPILAFGTAMKVGEGALRYSVNKSAVELLYLPLAPWIKDRSKVFIDTVVDRTAKGLAGVLLKVLGALSVGIQGVSMVTASLALVWFALSVVMRKRYVAEFREALDRGSMDLEERTLRLDDAAALGAIDRILAGPTDMTRRTLDVLIASSDAKIDRLGPRLADLARSPDPELAWRALLLSARAASPALAAAAEERSSDPDARVASAAARALLAVAPNPTASFVAAHARNDAAREAHAAGAVLAAGIDVPDEVVERLLRDDSPAGITARGLLAAALAEGRLPARLPLLRRLMADPEGSVATKAMRGAGLLNDPDLVPFLLTEIRLPTRREAVVEALARLGPSILPTLEAHLRDARLEAAVRIRVPRVMARIGGLEAHGMLRRALTLDDPALRHRVLRALNRMAHDEPGLHLPDDDVESELVAECHYLASLLAIASERGGGGSARPLFDRAISDSIRRARERAFRVLGLKGAGGRDWANAFAGLVNRNARLRASAVEFADGTLPERLRRIVVPLIDDIGASEALHRVGRHLDVEHLSREEAYVRAAGSKEPWLASCALVAGAEEGFESVLAVARLRSEDQHPWVRDAARFATRTATTGATAGTPRMAGDRTATEGLTIVERVLVLAKVPLLHEARSSDLASLAAAMHERRLDAGDVVHRAGDVPDAMHVIVSGRMRFERPGGPAIEATEGAFGAFGLFDLEPRGWTATAVEPTRILSIDRDAFVDVISDHVHVARGLMRTLASRLRRHAAEPGATRGIEDLEIG